MKGIVMGMGLSAGSIREATQAEIVLNMADEGDPIFSYKEINNATEDFIDPKDFITDHHYDKDINEEEVSMIIEVAKIPKDIKYLKISYR